jgi:hypothetical protein
MSGTATTQLGIGMTHQLQLMRSAHLIVLVVVVTARLHAHPQRGRDEGMPPAPDHRAVRTSRARGPEANSTVPLHPIGDSILTP